MTNALDSALHWLKNQAPSMEDAVARLVEINSFTDNRDGAMAVGKALGELLALDGLSASARPSPSGRHGDHLVWQTAAPGAPIALVGHLDTVFPPGKFEGYRRDGELGRGPGALDMKGGLVVVAYALSALAREGLLSALPLRLVIVSDEEIGSPEGRRVIESTLPGASAALVFEAGRQGDAIITQRKGTGGIVIQARGRAAHAGNNHRDGANAIWALARFIDLAQGLTDHARGRTVNVGKISGGQGKNTVPDQAEALVDLRFTSAEDGQRLMTALAEAARTAASGIEGTSIELSGGLQRLPLERSEASAALARRYGACAREEGLGDGEAPQLGGGSDANTTSAMGIASIDGLGPRGKGFHTTDEQIELRTLVPKARALARLLVGLSTPGA